MERTTSVEDLDRIRLLECINSIERYMPLVQTLYQKYANSFITLPNKSLVISGFKDSVIVEMSLEETYVIDSFLNLLFPVSGSLAVPDISREMYETLINLTIFLKHVYTNLPILKVELPSYMVDVEGISHRNILMHWLVRLERLNTIYFTGINIDFETVEQMRSRKFRNNPPSGQGSVLM